MQRMLQDVQNLWVQVGREDAKDVARCAESLGASGEGRCKRCAQGVQNLSGGRRRVLTDRRYMWNVDESNG